jgi:hypothetical protein
VAAHARTPVLRARIEVPRAIAWIGWAGLLMTAGVALDMYQGLPNGVHFVGAVLTCAAVAMCVRAVTLRGMVARVHARVLLPLLGAVALVACLFAVTSLGTPASRVYLFDSAVFNDANARLVLDGHNPYTSDGAFWQTVREHPQVAPTALRRGRYAGLDFVSFSRLRRDASAEAHGRLPRGPEFAPATLHSYPALAFLLDVPALALGAGSTAIVGLLVLVALGAAVLWGLPLRLAALGALVLLADGIFTGLTVRGWFEAAGLVPAVLAFRLRGRPLASGVLIGLACAVKQVLWPLAPLSLVLDLRRGDRRAAVVRAGGIAAGFLVPNLPFILDAPLAWLHSMLLPMSLPMFPLGIGLVSPSVDLGLPTLPPLVYAACEAGALAAIAWALWRWRDRLHDEVALVLFALPFLVAWRSLDNYVAFLPVVALAAWRARVVAESASARSASRNGGTSGWTRPSGASA